MKSYIKYILGFALAILFAFGIYNIASIYNLKLLKNNIDYSVVNKNMQGAGSMTIDSNNNIYISKETSIKTVTAEGKEKVLISGSEYNIEDILYDENKIYFITKDKIEFIDLETEKVDIFKDKIPLSGNGITRKLFKINNDMCISIGAITNSGIADDQNYEIPSFDMVLSGNNFGKNENIAYCKIPGDRCSVGEKIKKQNIGNGAIYKIDKKTKEFKLFANGIRGICGIDTDSKNKVYPIFQGMENSGARPVKGDSDYIYEVKENKFYGFPDYSGGDYIESPRFEDDNSNLVKPILLEIPDSFDREAKPVFVSQNQGTLNGLAVDKNGSIFSKDSILFFDNKTREVQVVNKEGKLTKAIKTSDKSYISDIIYNNEQIYMLDSNLGYVYKVTKKASDKEFGIPLSVWIYITMFSSVMFVILIVKYLRNKK